MALLQNNYNAAGLRFLGGTPASLANSFGRGGWALWNALAFGVQTSWPVGEYELAVKRPVKDGGLGGRSAGVAAGSVGADGIGDLTPTCAGGATTGGAITGLKDAVCTAAGSATTAAAIEATANISASLQIGELTQDDVTGAVMEAVVEGSITVKQALRFLLSIAVGKTDITGSTVTFRDTADTKDRVVASMTGSERTTVTLDGT
jgi:hypothetical protein